MKRSFKAVMHCTAKETSTLVDRSNNVITGLSSNTNTYPQPNPAVDELKAETSILAELSGQAKGSSQKKQARDQQAIKVYGMLLAESNYVNSVAKGDKAIILLSGFDVSAEPSPHPVPDVPVIKRIEDGNAPHSAKIFLAKITSPLLTTREKLTFIVQMCTDDSKEENWKTVLQTQNSKSLILLSLVRKEEYLFRIAVMNARGQSDWSETASFVSQ
jgi:hypothetical protein